MSLAQRVMIGLVSVVACLGVLIEGHVAFTWMFAKGVTFSDALIRYFSYFTVLTNTFIALYGAFCFFGGERRWGGPVFHASVKTCLAVSIFFVSAGYTILLRNLIHLTGIAMYSDMVLHYVVPALFLLYWIIYVSRQVVPWTHAGWWTLYPILYFLYALVQGERTGLYPYPFINVAQIGYRHAFFNGGILLVLYWLGALLFIAMARLRLKQEAHREISPL